MKVARETLTLASEERMEFLDITKQIRDAVQKHPITSSSPSWTAHGRGRSTSRSWGSEKSPLLLSEDQVEVGERQ